MCHFFRTYLMMIISPRASYLSPHEFNTEVIIFSIKKFLKKQYMGPKLVKVGKFMLMRDQIFSVAVEVKYQLELFCKDNISNSLCSLYILPSPLGFCPVRVHLYSLEPIPTSPFLCLDLCSEDSDKYSISSHSTPDLLQTLSEN